MSLLYWLTVDIEFQEIQEKFKEALGAYAMSFTEDPNSAGSQLIKQLSEENIMLKSEIVTLKSLVNKSSEENARLKKRLESMGKGEV